MLGIYIHIPFCRSKCGYCSFVSNCDLSLYSLYEKNLLSEIEIRKDSSPCDTIYIGGGTPSILPNGALSKILNAVKKHYNIASDVEITVEANPDSCTREFVNECRAGGVNRISLGLQTHDDKILRSIKRPHSYKDFCIALENVFNAGIFNVGVDLMLGFAGQDMNSVIKSLKCVCEFDIKHVSLYSLKIEENTPFYHQGIVVDEDLQAQMYEQSVQFLNDYGFFRYEISNFAKKGFHSRHNSKYWNMDEYVGLGASAHSFINDTRLANTDNLSTYNLGKFLDCSQKIPTSELIKECIMLSLRTCNGLDTRILKHRYNYDIFAHRKQQIDHLVNSKAIIVHNDHIKICDDAFYILNSIILSLAF